VSNRLLAILGGLVGVLVLGIVVLAVVVVSNGGSSNSSKSASNTAASSNNSAGNGTAQPSSGGNSNASNTSKSNSGGSASSGNVLHLPGNDPLTLDPAQAFDTDSSSYIVEIFGGLVQLDQKLNVIPDIAAAMPQVSADGTVYTFKLRTDVVFQNSNRRVTAADFKYSMERAASPDTASPTADQYLNDIVGEQDFFRGKAKEISGVKVIDDQTLQITIDAAKPYFLKKLTYPTAYVVDKDQITKDPRNWSQHPNGTGPFRLKSYSIGNSLVLVANDHYHLGAPKVGEIDFSLAGGSSLTQYEQNQVDISGVGVDDIDRAHDQSDPLSKDFISKPILSTFYVGFNNKTPPFDDPKVRQAFSEAIDKQQLVDTILKNIVPQANSILPPGMPGYNKDAKALPFDPTAAKQLLQQSKYAGKLPPLTFTTSGQGADVGPVDDAILQMWKDNLGVDIQVQQADPGTFFAAVRAGKYQMWDAGWEADYPDAQDFLDVNFFSTSSLNDVRYNNPQVDQLLTAARTEQDATKRTQDYQQAEQIILNDAAWLPLFYDQSNVVVKPYVKGYDIPGMIIPIYRYVSIQR
jgi:oligopeptide transport system substrate-binding protein